MKYLILCLLCVCSVLAGPGAFGAKKPEICVDKLHVIKGCAACETMMEWLRAGGVNLEISHVEQGAFKLYPMVLYSDKSGDHGDRMYKQQVTIPGKICVISCSIGTN